MGGQKGRLHGKGYTLGGNLQNIYVCPCLPWTKRQQALPCTLPKSLLPIGPALPLPPHAPPPKLRDGCHPPHRCHHQRQRRLAVRRLLLPALPRRFHSTLCAWEERVEPALLPSAKPRRPCAATAAAAATTEAAGAGRRLVLSAGDDRRPLAVLAAVLAARLVLPRARRVLGGVDERVGVLRLAPAVAARAAAEPGALLLQRAATAAAGSGTGGGALGGGLEARGWLGWRARGCARARRRRTARRRTWRSAAASSGPSRPSARPARTPSAPRAPRSTARPASEPTARRARCPRGP